MCVARLMRGLSLRTMETVATETLASRATSRMEIFAILAGRGGGRGAAAAGEPWAGRRVFPRLFGMLVKQFTCALNAVKLSRINAPLAARGRQTHRIIDNSVKPIKLNAGSRPFEGPSRTFVRGGHTREAFYPHRRCLRRRCSRFRRFRAAERPRRRDQQPGRSDSQLQHLRDDGVISAGRIPLRATPVAAAGSAGRSAPEPCTWIPIPTTSTWLRSGNSLNDNVVIHLDTKPGGFTDAAMNDYRRSGPKPPDQLTADVDDTFPAGVLPDYGVVIGGFGEVSFELTGVRSTS
jgi:hypothetical protein